eukprot:GHRR01015343.1.p1 GENE.GHRR01015343.1~~GHRR01015343.1.p1  ORF type:complete len:133 (-),score=24.47 GHRR01015343.1:332-730(-)
MAFVSGRTITAQLCYVTTVITMESLSNTWSKHDILCCAVQVEDFMLWDLDKVALIISSSEEYKPNVNLVVIDFLIRHGCITPEEPGRSCWLTGIQLAESCCGSNHHCLLCKQSCCLAVMDSAISFDTSHLKN